MQMFSRLFVIAFLTLRNGCFGFLEQFKFNECYHSNNQLDLYGITYKHCVDECQSRAKCSAITMNRLRHHCRLHFGTITNHTQCLTHGFVYSEKSSWKQAVDCGCGPRHTCNSDTGTCEITECPQAEQINHGTFLGNQRHVGDKILYTCDEGFYMMEGTGTSTCQSTGYWSLSGDNLPHCVRELCDAGWTRVGGYCRMFVTTLRSWWDSEANCRSLGGHLTHIYSLQDLVDIQTLITCSFGTGGCHPWVGINDVEAEGVFKGMEGKMVPGDILDQLTGNVDNDDCVYFDTRYTHMQLKTYNCIDVDSSICEQ